MKIEIKKTKPDGVLLENTVIGDVFKLDEPRLDKSVRDGAIYMRTSRPPDKFGTWYMCLVNGYLINETRTGIVYVTVLNTTLTIEDPTE